MEARHTHALHTRGHTVFSMLFSMSGETILPSTILHYRHLALLLYPIPCCTTGILSCIDLAQSLQAG